MVNAAHRLGELPRLAKALASGELSLEKVCEVARYATPQTEARIIRWAKRVGYLRVKEEADTSVGPARDEQVLSEETRYLIFSDDLLGGTYIEARLPALEGAQVKAAIDAVASELPSSPVDSDDPDERRRQKRADALVELTRAGTADAPPPTLVVHVPAETLLTGDGPPCRTSDGGLLDPREVARLACEARIERIDHDGNTIVGVGRAARIPPPALPRALEARDGHRCTFPGCGSRRALIAHHIKWWTRDQGPTDLHNLVLVCPTHHKLIHTHGWDVRLEESTVVWLRPGGSRLRAGPGPPRGPTYP